MIVTRNPRGATAVEAPRRPDGGLYRFEMIYDGLKYRAYADTATALCGSLIPGYDELEDDAEQAAARIRFAAGMQVQLQAAIAAEAGLEACTPAERDVLLGPRHVPPEVASWEADVPLVLVDVFDEPQGELPRPAGRPRGGGEPDCT
ncbi:MAG: hypothetical protein M3N31_02320 [Actinomycetota bacterium]|nr:hypothetical protein [Actinomycetota bacterium]